jgi:hypothetical protein
MDSLDRLLSLEDIRQLRFRYARFIDTKQWDAVGTLLTEDAVLDLSGTSRLALGPDHPAVAPVSGREAICAFLADRYGQAEDLLHIATMPEISFLDDVTALGIWRQETFVRTAAGRDGKSGVAYGFVRDRYARIDGVWLMQKLSVDLRLIT